MVVTYEATLLMMGAKLVGPYSWMLWMQPWYAARIPSRPATKGLEGLKFLKK